MERKEAVEMERLIGLGHHCHRGDACMFLDDRKTYMRRSRRRRLPVVAWLNPGNVGRSWRLNIVNRQLKLLKAIPSGISFGDAIEFVYSNTTWTI